jgi:hypothetical protein
VRRVAELGSLGGAARVLTIEQLLDLFAVAFAHGHRRSSVPTAESVSRINRELGIVLPVSFVEFSRRCPGYSTLFASIGEDFNDAYHILNINRDFHGDEPHYRVPSWLVVFNHGHDEDCDGFDSRKLGADGEYPVVYWDASQGVGFDNARWPVFTRFNDYLEFTLTYHANISDKERAERIIRTA